MLGFLFPKNKLTTKETRLGLKMMMVEAPFTQIMVMLTTGAFLVAFVREMTDSNVVIGVVVAMGPLAGVLQVPATILIERLRTRKLVMVSALSVSRLLLLAAPLLPLFLPIKLALPLFIVVLFLRYSVGHFGACAYSSWIRDLIPERVMSRFLARRLAVLIGIGAVVALGGGILSDHLKASVEHPIVIYSIILAFGGLAGLLSLPAFIIMPEPKMAPPTGEKIGKIISAPFHDSSYRNWIFAWGIWNFAVNLSGPFFVVHMLTKLQLTMTQILSLQMITQLLMVVLTPVWGRIADKLSHKSILLVCFNIILLQFVLWTFTSMPDRYAMMFPLLFLIYVMGGVSWSGVWLSAGNIALRTSPKGRATSYLAANALVAGIAATLGPVTGGLLADWFADLQFSIPMNFSISGSQVVSLSAICFSGYDFLFLLSFLFGLLAVYYLRKVKVSGEAAANAVMPAFYSEIQRKARRVTHMMGLLPRAASPEYSSGRWSGRSAAIKSEAETPKAGALNNEKSREAQPPAAKDTKTGAGDAISSKAVPLLPAEVRGGGPSSSSITFSPMSVTRHGEEDRTESGRMALHNEPAPEKKKHIIRVHRKRRKQA